MKASQLKVILDSLVHPSHRNFTVRLSNTHTRRRMGTYFFRRKEIVIYEPCCRTDMRILGTALHEITHHVVEETYGPMLRARRRLMSGRGRYSHGAAYVSRLGQIVRTFNWANRDKLQGTFHYEKRRPRVPPQFVPFPPKPSQAGEFPTPRE